MWDTVSLLFRIFEAFSYFGPPDPLRAEVLKSNGSYVVAGTTADEQGRPVPGSAASAMEYVAFLGGGETGPHVETRLGNIQTQSAANGFRFEYPKCSGVALVFGGVGFTDEAIDIRAFHQDPDGGLAGSYRAAFIKAAPPYSNTGLKVVLHPRKAAPAAVVKAPLELGPPRQDPWSADANFARLMFDEKEKRYTFTPLTRETAKPPWKPYADIALGRWWRKADHELSLVLSFGYGYGGFVPVPAPGAGKPWPDMTLAPVDFSMVAGDIVGYHPPYYSDLPLDQTTLLVHPDGTREARFYLKFFDKYGRGVLRLEPPDDKGYMNGAVKGSLELTVQGDGGREIPP